MELKTFCYTKSEGWSIKSFPKWDSPHTLVLVFASPEFIHHQQPFHEIHRAYPNAIMLGCSTGGEIYGASLLDSCIVVSVIKFKNTELRLANTKISSNHGSFTAGAKIAQELVRGDLCGLFVLSDGIQVNGSELVNGLNSIVPKNIVVTGGLAGDGARFKNTWVLINDKIQSGSVVGVGFYGENVRIGHGSRGGWESFGPDRRITKSKGNILYELDEKPALLLYKKYLGDRAKELPASGLLFPVAIRENSQDSKEIVRTILGIDEPSQALIFAGDMPSGYVARLMRANFDHLITGANNAALKAAEKQKKASPLLAIAISCIGRRLLLGEYTEEEIEATLDSFPKHTRQVGFYSYGEISPFSTGHCDLHNQTMTITTISEEDR
jgi:hypothetical protein